MIILIYFQGNARVDYRVLPSWEHADQFVFADESVLNGSLLPGAIQNAEILFKPDAVIFYETEIYFQTQITKRVLHLTGQGVFLNFFLIITRCGV